MRLAPLGPLSGAPVQAPLPSTALSPGNRRILFRWEYHEKLFHARGDGVARVAPPDSVRLDFFLENGASSGFVILIADSVSLPEQEQAARVVPPVPLLWAGLGRLAVQGPDTAARVDGDTLRADIGREGVWRATFVGRRLVGLQRALEQKVVEWVVRRDSGVTYRHPRARRTLVLSGLRELLEAPFDPSIWHR